VPHKYKGTMTAWHSRRLHEMPPWHKDRLVPTHVYQHNVPPLYLECLCRLSQSSLDDQRRNSVPMPPLIQAFQGVLAALGKRRMAVMTPTPCIG
jgi:hypothetical protein